MTEYRTQVFLDIREKRPTYYIFWYPIKEMHIDPEKPEEINFYTDGGPLQKYDEAFKTESQAYEKKHNYQENIPEIRGWEGHCDLAALTTSLLPNEPKKEVVFNDVKFTPNDVKALLCKSVFSLPFSYDWVGFRYPEKARDLRDPAQDPVPSKLYKKLQEWKESGLEVPIIADIDPYTEVWNFAFDYILWVMTDKTNGYVRFSSTGFPKETKTWYFNTETDRWLKEGPEYIPGKQNPDFVWRPYTDVDLLKEENWPQESKKNMNPFYNKYISPRNVYKLYIRSIDVKTENQ